MSESPTDLRAAVWNAEVVNAGSSQGPDRATELVLEQYKIYVEMADRISARRGLTNSFFLTINLAAIGLLGSLAGKPPRGLSDLIPSVALAILLGQCIVWFWILRSYRLLNKAKYAVIAILEERLPARVYSRGEWCALLRYGAHGKYFRLTGAEQALPMLFAVGYGVLFTYLVLG